MHNSKKKHPDKFNKKEKKAHKEKETRGSKRHPLVEYYRKDGAGEITRAAESNIRHIIPLIQFLYREKEMLERG